MGVEEAIMGVGVAGGLIEGANASSRQSEYAEAQAKIAEEQWQFYLDNIAPVLQQAAEQSMQPAREQTGYLNAMGDLNRNYANAAANTRKTLAGRYESGAGVEQAAQTANELNRTRSQAGLEADWNQQAFNQMMQVANAGAGLPGQANSTYGNLSNMYGQQANQAYGAAGSAANNAMQYYAMQNMMQPATATTGAVGGSYSFG